MEGVIINEGEEFKQIKDFPDYFISNQGRLYSTKTKRFIGNINKKIGYKMATLSLGRKSDTLYIHHLVMRYFGEPKPEIDFEIDHRDKNGLNNDINNLRWVSHQVNLENRNAYRKDRKKRLTKREIEIFNRWYVYNRTDLINLSNEKVAMKFEAETKIPINPITVRNNRDMWRLDDSTNRIYKIHDSELV